MSLFPFREKSLFKIFRAWQRNRNSTVRDFDDCYSDFYEYSILVLGKRLCNVLVNTLVEIIVIVIGHLKRQRLLTTLLRRAYNCRFLLPETERGGKHYYTWRSQILEKEIQASIKLSLKQF